MNTPTRHAVYAASAAAHHHPYYYESGMGPYPHYLGPYHYAPAPPGAPLNGPATFYDHHLTHPANSKYHLGAASGPAGRPIYPPYLNEHYAMGPGGEYGPAALHPYFMGPPHAAYEDSP